MVLEGAGPCHYSFNDASLISRDVAIALGTPLQGGKEGTAIHAGCPCELWAALDRFGQLPVPDAFTESVGEEAVRAAHKGDGLRLGAGKSPGCVGPCPPERVGLPLH